MPRTIPPRLADIPPGRDKTLLVEHPSGRTEVVVHCGDDGAVIEAGILRTARKLFDGVAFG